MADTTTQSRGSDVLSPEFERCAGCDVPVPAGSVGCRPCLERLRLVERLHGLQARRTGPLLLLPGLLAVLCVVIGAVAMGSRPPELAVAVVFLTIGNGLILWLVVRHAMHASLRDDRERRAR